MAEPSYVVVVGGGIAGLVAATEAARTGSRVVLIEAAPECGGLLRSVTTAHGDVFDYGTHLPTQTGRDDVDQGYIDVWGKDEAVRPAHLVPGGYSFGTLRPWGMWMDWNGAEPAAHARWVRGLMTAAANLPESGPGAFDVLRSRFGEEATVEGYAPVLRKLQTVGPEELAPDVVALFGLHRTAALTPDATRLLKHDPGLDARLAFHDCREQPRDRAVIYPAQGGTGAWIRRLVERAEALGVTVLTSCKLLRVVHDGPRVVAVETATHGTLPCAQLVWTIPPHLLLQAAGEPFVAERPRMLNTVLIHLVYDDAPCIESQFVTCFDPNVRAFRVTLYSNFRPPTPGRYPVTVEFLTAPQDAAGLQVETAMQELVQMGVMAPGARLLDSLRDEHVAGFPVLTHSFVAQGSRLAQQVQGRFTNVFLAGKARGQDFFMIDVMTRVVDELPSWLASQADA
jgi:protoporphyrinogen oxidase